MSEMNSRDLSLFINDNAEILSYFFDHISDMVFLMSVEDDCKFRYLKANPAAMKAAGLSKASYGKLIEEVMDENIAELLNQKYREAVEAGHPISFVVDRETSGDTLLTPIFNRAGVCTHVFAITRDITERRKLEEQLQYLAFHDPLTELPNRRLFLELAKNAISTAKRSCHMLALLFLDCDLFKGINDTWGHEIGDEFLREFAKRLKESVRGSDLVARFGGDEFVILLSSIAGRQEVEQIVQRILQSISRPIEIGELCINSSASIGIALFPDHGNNAELLIRHADLAMYEAKAEGRNQYRFYTSGE